MTHTFEENISVFGNLPQPKIFSYMRHEESREYYTRGCSFELTEMNFVTSLGTYIDAPYHRYPDGRDISTLSLEELILPGILVDLSGKKSREPITETDIEEGLYAQKQAWLAVLLWTGWDRYWKTDSYKDGPYLDGQAARTLLKYGIKLVGIDTLNIDDFQDRSRPAHTLLLKSNCLIVENLTGLGQLKGRHFEFAALPMKVKGAASFPVRALARIWDKKKKEA